MTTVKYITMIILLTLSNYGCSASPLDVETKEGETVKIHIKTPFQPCRLRTKHDEALIRCEWVI